MRISKNKSKIIKETGDNQKAGPMTADTTRGKPIRVSVELDPEIIMHLDNLKNELGYKKRGEVLSYLIKELFAKDAPKTF